MKKFALSILFIGCTFLLTAHNPVESTTLLEEAGLKFSLTALSQHQYFDNVTFDRTNKSIDVKTSNKIIFIQIFDANGKLKYQLPVKSNDVSISKNFFSKGYYAIGFMLQGSKEVQFTHLYVD